MQHSRIGLSPGPIHSKDAKGSKKSRSNRSRGITMEDLKRQTALRLAQEQNEQPLQQDIYVGGVHVRQPHMGELRPRTLSNNYSSPSDISITYSRPIQHPQDSLHWYHHQHAKDGIPNVDINFGQEQLQRQHVSSQQQSAGSVGTSSYNQMNTPSQDQNMIPYATSESRIMESHLSSNYTLYLRQQSMHRSPQPLQPTSNISLPPNDTHLHHQQSFTPFTPDCPHFSTMSTRNNQNVMKNKLPHGLTVHELKEMTKARLQSEAAEKANNVGEVQAISRDRVSPLDFDSGEPIRDRAMSRDSSSTGRVNSSHATSFFQNHHVSPKIQPQSQMLQSGYPSNVLGGVPSSSFQSTTARNDTWESASVASHNSTIYSDNLGSESASEVGSFCHSSRRNRSFTYPAVQVVDSLDVASALATYYGYKESRSFSNPSPVQASPLRGAGVIGGQPIFNATVGGNRRRAVTLSPNTGSILEDRPLRYDSVEPSDRLEIPNFASGTSDSNGLSAALPTLNTNRGYSPVLEQLGLGLENSYRSNGIDSTNIFRGETIKSGSSLRGMSQIDSREQENLHSLGSNKEQKSNVFRLASTKSIGVAGPPDVFTKAAASPSSEIAFSRVRSMDRYLSIDSESKFDRSQHFKIRKSHLSPDTLVNDFGSVLDLSGSEYRDRERANTYAFDSRLNHSENSNLKETSLF